MSGEAVTARASEVNDSTASQPPIASTITDPTDAVNARQCAGAQRRAATTGSHTESTTNTAHPTRTATSGATRRDCCHHSARVRNTLCRSGRYAPNGAHGANPALA